MILIEKRWDKSLLTLKYGDGYDVRVHGAQIALCLLARRSQTVGSNINSANLSLIKFGFYDVETENAIGLFQDSVGLPKSKILDQITYTYLFDLIRTELNSIIVQVAEKRLQIQEVTSDMVDEDYEIDSNSSLVVDDSYNNSIFGDSTSATAGSYYDEQSDEEREALDIRAIDNDFFDKFWGAMSQNYDSVFLSATNNTRSFGSGGSFNLSGGSTDSFNGRYKNTSSDSDDYGSNYIDSLLSNSIYSGNYDYTKPSSWVSNSSMSINVDGYSYESSEKHKTFFSSQNSSTTRKSNYDITVVYGANGQFAKKILGVVHRSRTQQVDSSGEAIFDVIEFIAKDIIETDNTRK